MVMAMLDSWEKPLLILAICPEEICLFNTYIHSPSF